MPKPRKMRRLNNSTRPLVLSQDWTSVTNKVLKCTLSYNENDDSIACAIMQEPTHSVHVDGLSNCWMFKTPRGEPSDVTDRFANTIVLPCSHCFHPCALALHFLTSNMKYPVCRCGFDERMHFDVIHASLRPEFDAKVTALTTRTEDEIETRSNVLSQADLLSIISNLQLQVRFFSSCNSTRSHLKSVVNTRLTIESNNLNNLYNTMFIHNHDATEINLTSLNVYRSFQRIIRGIFERQTSYADCTVVFTLEHPLIPITISSVEIPARDMYNQLFNCMSMNGTPLECEGSINLFSPQVAGSEHVATLNSKYSLQDVAPQITVAVNMHMIVNIATQVSDFLSSLENAILMDHFDSSLSPD